MSWPVGASLVSLVAVAVSISGCGSSADSAGSREAPLLVAAAADLRPAFTELGERYEQQTGRRVTFTFGASGQLAKQLENGAPYALFASASMDYVDQVLAAGRGDRSSRMLYAYGRLAIWSPKRAVTLDELATAPVRTVAIANPEHAPYGKAAVQALRSAGLLRGVKPKLVYGDNVGAAQQLAATGNADAAIVGRALALAAGGELTDVPRQLHQPIAQGLVITGTGAAARQAEAFVELLQSPEGQAVLQRDGFVLPDADADALDSAAPTTAPAR